MHHVLVRKGRFDVQWEKNPRPCVRGRRSVAPASGRRWAIEGTSFPLLRARVGDISPPTLIVTIATLSAGVRTARPSMRSGASARASMYPALRDASASGAHPARTRRERPDLPEPSLPRCVATTRMKQEVITPDTPEQNGCSKASSGV